MNYKDPKIQIIAFVVMLFMAASYLWYSKVFSVYAEKITAKKVQYEKELADLHSVKQKAATLDDLQREFDNLTMKYKRVELLLPETKEDEPFLSQIHAAAQVTNSTVLDMTPMYLKPAISISPTATRCRWNLRITGWVSFSPKWLISHSLSTFPILI